MKKISLLFMVTAAMLLRAQIGSDVVLPQDKGPKRIDVSAYPAEMQKGYKVFAEKCSKCHTLARPVNTTMTREEWERYVKRMMHKPNSGIGDKHGKEIFEFLVFDEAHRKAANPKAFYPALSDEQIRALQAKQ